VLLHGNAVQTDIWRHKSKLLVIASTIFVVVYTTRLHARVYRRLMSKCNMQEHQFAAQQKEKEEKAVFDVLEPFRQKTILMECQLAEQKLQVRNSKSGIVPVIHLCSLCVRYVEVYDVNTFLFSSS